MSNTLFQPKDFQSILPYVPEDAKRILDAELPRIREKAVEQIDQFAESLVNELTAQLKALGEKQAQELKQSQDDLKKQLDDYVKKQAPDPNLTKATNELNAAIEEQRKRFLNAGVFLRQSVLTALKTHGLPVDKITAVIGKLDALS